jgi:hypothetical protein
MRARRATLVAFHVMIWPAEAPEQKLGVIYAHNLTETA